MQLTEAASQAACDTGSWLQKFKCGYHDPGAAHAGVVAGHAAGPVVLLALIALIVFLVVRARVLGGSSRRRGAAARGN